MIKFTAHVAMAKPFLAFDLPEHRFTVRHAVLYAKPKDELDFAKKIALPTDDQSLRAEMGQIGIERIKSDLYWSRQERHLVSIYDSL